MRELLFTTTAPANYYVVEDENISRAKVITFLENYNSVAVLSSQPKRAFEKFAEQMEWVEAAGGVVANFSDDLLMIHLRGRWDLPKGMVEKGETLTQAALREVQEETGIEQPSIGALIAKTYHIYDLYGGWHLKQTSWYRMTTTERQPTLPQQQEGITAAVWVSHEECLRLLNQSFASLRMVAQKISIIWPKN
jgi:8-oxo-dGTP pyrophosphatase MutT (NUDIX family)